MHINEKSTCCSKYLWLQSMNQLFMKPIFESIEQYILLKIVLIWSIWVRVEGSNIHVRFPFRAVSFFILYLDVWSTVSPRQSLKNFKIV